MFTIHVISDLRLGLTEQTPEEEQNLPDVDLVILNGNIGVLKRTIMYAFELCKKYPDVQFVYNDGQLERYWGQAPKETKWEHENSLGMRISSSDDWPKNLHWRDPRKEAGMLITLRTGKVVDIYTDYGFPKIVSYTGDWKETDWYKNYCIVAEYVHNLPKWGIWPEEANIVKQGVIPLWFTKDYINDIFSQSELKLKRWESGKDRSKIHSKILVTHLSHHPDVQYKNCKVSPYVIHMRDKVWVTSGSKVDQSNFLGGRLYSNPGRGILARSQTFSMD